MGTITLASSLIPTCLMRFAAGVVLLVIAAILYGSGSGGWWRALLVVVAAGAFYGAYRMPRAVEEERAARR